MLGWALMVNALTMARHRAAEDLQAAADVTLPLAPPTRIKAVLKTLREPGWRYRDRAHLQSLDSGAPVDGLAMISARFSTGPGQVAQLAEHAAENRGVGSSILPLATRSVHDLAAADLGPAGQHALVHVGGRGYSSRCEGLERVVHVARAVVVVQLVPREQVAQAA